MNRKGLGSIQIIFATLVVLLLFGVIFYLALSKKSTSLKTGTNIPQPSSSVEPKAVTDSTLGQYPTTWSLYTNDQYNYSIKYPGDWSSRPENNPDRIQSSVYFGKFVPQDSSAREQLRGWIVMLTVLDNPKKLSPQAFFADHIFWVPDGGTADMSDTDIQKETQARFNKAEKIVVGKDKIPGYRFTVGGVLTSIIDYWFINDKAYQLTYSFEDQSFGYTSEIKKAIVTTMLDSFSLK